MNDLLQNNGTQAWAAAGFVGSVHASSVAIHGRGVMIGGASGAGKSDLALRLIDRGATLVSDDYTLVARGDDDRVIASPAPNIEGLIEVRGIGVVPLPYVGDVSVELVVIGTTAGDIERMPDGKCALRLCGKDIPLLHLSLLEASAPLKVEMSLQQIRQAQSKATEQ